MSFRRRVTCVVLGLCTLAAGLLPAAAQVFPYDLRLEKILDNTAELGAMAQAPNGDLWLLERSTGIVRVLRFGKELTNLTISVKNTGQSGLLDVAFAPDFNLTGQAFVVYVEGAAPNHLVVNQITLSGAALALGTRILDLGGPTDYARPGGSLLMGKDGKLYVGVGDLGTPGNAQADAYMQGKILRANLDGTVPSDNPTPGSLVWAKGFRNIKGMAINPNTARTGGTIYAGDQGTNTAPTAADEVNQIKPGANYGWNIGSGAQGAPYTDPVLTTAAGATMPQPEALALVPAAWGGLHANSLAVAMPNLAAAQRGQIRELQLQGAEFDALKTNAVLYAPAADGDGTLDATCPTKVNTLATGQDGNMYLANTGNNLGIYRIYKNGTGPREVSPRGTPFPLTVDRSGSQVKLGWEYQDKNDANLAKRHAASGQPANAFQVYEGSLPLSGTYNHTMVQDTAGTADGLARLTVTFSPAGGNRYFLVGAQGGNILGSLGTASSGTARTIPGTTDFCPSIGVGRNVGNCAKEWTSAATGATLRLQDLNPRSPTYQQYFTLADFRGKVVKMALSSENCYWCTVEAQDEGTVNKGYEQRDFVFVSLFTATYGYFNPIPPAECATRIAAWANAYLTDSIIVCDPDTNGDNASDVSDWYDQCNCAPQNYYIDKGGVIYNMVQGAQFAADVISVIGPEINTEFCE